MHNQPTPLYENEPLRQVPPLSPRTDHVESEIIVKSVFTRAQILHELKIYQEINQKVLAALPLGLLAYDETGQCVLANEAAAQIVGDSQSELRKQNFCEIAAWKQLGLFEMVQQVLSTGQRDHQQVYYKNNFGKGLWLDIQSKIVTIDGQPYILLIIDDISEQKLAEWQLTQHRSHMEEQVQARTIDLQTANLQLQQQAAERKRIEDQLQYQATLLQNVSDAIIATDLHFIITAWNRAAESLYGWSVQEALGKSLSELIPTEYLHSTSQQIIQKFIEDEGWRGEVVQTNKFGKRIPIMASVAMVKDTTGNAIGTVSLLRDITTAKETEDQLLTLSSAVEQSPVSILITDTSGAIEYVNPKFTQLTGYHLDDVKGQTPRVLKSGTTSEAEYRNLWQTITAGGQWRGELHNRAKDGSLFWESALISPIVNASGKTTHFVAIKEDIGERKHREREQGALLNLAMALRAATGIEEMLPSILQQSSMVLDSSMSFFVAYDLLSGSLAIKAAYRQGELLYDLDMPINGDSISSAVLQSGAPYWSDDILADPHFAMPSLIVDERAMGCVPLIVHNEILGLLWVMRIRPFSAGDAKLMSAVADMAALALHRARLHDKVMRYTNDLEQEVAIRTRELAEANERLHELDRLKSKFVSDVTHELRTPVTNISLYLRLLERKPEKQAEYLSILLEQAERLRTLVKDTLDLSKLDQLRDNLNLVEVDLSALTQSVVTAHMARAESLNLTLSYTPAANLPTVSGDYDKLTQVITNLVTNALNYTPQGQVNVRTTFNVENQTVCCEIQDTGCGIDADDLPHLFDRFYRGKRDQMAPVPGTGLGLSIVKEIVEMHGGRVSVTSEVGIGSTFTLCLPLSRQCA